jgi:apolipoprotein N-acyltransferase
MVVYGGLAGWVGVLVNALLVAILSLFPGIFASITRRLVVVYGPVAVLAAPLVWVATELGRTYLTDFPWVLLGYSQIGTLPIAQLASLVGVYGLSALLVLVSATLVIATERSFAPARRVAPLAAVFVAVIAIAAWGSRRMAASAWTREGEPIRVGLIQGNVDQGIKWDPARASAIFDDYIAKTRQAILEGATFLIWPESSTPFMFEEDPPSAARVRALVQQAHVTMLFGSDQIERGTPPKFYNSAFVLRRDGTTAGVYRKIHLVPFGEYVPFQKLLVFAAPLTEQVGSFTAGGKPDVLPVEGHSVSVAICYEVVYPALMRAFVSAGSELLTTITNDAWFGPTSAPYQHFEQAAMRAIEEGRYLVRAANTGISGIVDPYGRVLAASAIFQPAVVVGEARFLETSTFYARHGDVLAGVSVLATVALLAARRRRVQ